MVKSGKNWYKHLDFIIIDYVCLIVSFFGAILIRNGLTAFDIGFWDTYQSALLVIILVNAVYVLLMEPYKGILKRGYFLEFAAVVRHGATVFVGLIICMYALKQTFLFSRMVSFLLPICFIIISYSSHLIYKVILRKTAKSRKPKDYVILVGNTDNVSKMMDSIMQNVFMSISIAGIVLTDSDVTEYKGVRVVNKEDIFEFIQNKVVDEVFIDASLQERMSYADDFLAMGLTVNFAMDDIFGFEMAEMRKYCGIPVVSVGINRLSNHEVAIKRIIDIFFGIIGCVITLVLTVIIGPLIFISSPGPIFFKQKRVGKNGRRFYIWKFRTMYPDAEQRKKELMDQNEMSGQMFKMENDPRIIGSGKDGTKRGLGHFLRKSSLDEFPQFFNVLKGDMSLVGTRPPTVDEVKEYESHHKSRLAMKPGLTGMWQVSGRSEIMDFEKVVELDNYYIKNFSLGLDVKIIGKTFVVLIKRQGAK